MDLIAYRHENWSQPIRPASPHREWMDRSPESFATRCLPLNIANAHGWEILSPIGFAACWNGQMRTQDVTFQFEDPPGHHPPVSMFGQGTFSMHIQALFRTPPGYDLFITGPPNWFKDGVAPLSAVVETDWSPYTFAMSWKFTRPDHWIRWEANEPICFVFPVQRGLLEQFTPKFVPLDDDPDTAKQFAAWSASRNAFHAEMDKNQPLEPSEKWQKLYYSGRDMNGRKADNHLAKLRLKPFAT